MARADQSGLYLGFDVMLLLRLCRTRATSCIISAGTPAARGPEGVYVSALGAPDGNGPGGTFMLDPETFDIRGRWEIDRGPQHLAYDLWWHLGQDTMITSTWGTPNMVKDGVNPELLLSGKYGNTLHIWDLRRRRHVQELDLGAEQQMALELRSAHDPTRAYGFVGVVLSLKDLSIVNLGLVSGIRRRAVERSERHVGHQEGDRYSR